MATNSFMEKVLSRKPKPDIGQLLKVLKKGKPDRFTLFEFFLNRPLYEKLAGEKFPDDPAMPLAECQKRSLKVTAKAFAQAGYDYVTFMPGRFGFPAGQRHRESTCSLNEGAIIRDRESFEKYQWLEPIESEYEMLETAGKHLAEGQKIIVHGPGGVLENVIALVGYDAMCYMLLDDPALMKDIFDAIGSRLVRHYAVAASFASVAACISNDDWGFKTQPMLSPDDMRKYLFPWHKRIVDTIHAAGKPAILHSCGNAAEIWEDIIAGLGYDGKHSYEDVISPVEKEYDRYAGRIALLGGIDVDFICKSKPEDVYKRSRKMLERSQKKGSYALGTGNSVPEYIPRENYAAMIWAAIEDRG